MAEFDYVQDDLKKVVPLLTGENEYVAEPGDVPRECIEPGPERLSVRSSSGKICHVTVLRISCPVEDDLGQTVAGMQYRLYLPSGEVLCGETNAEGWIEEFVTLSQEGEVLIETEDGTRLRVDMVDL